MEFFEMDKMWHDIRARIAKEEEGSSVEERVARANKLAEGFCKKYGLKMVKATRRGRDK
jgi:hypothetical protein